MKMSREHFDLLKSAITPLDTKERRARYRRGDFPRAERTKGLDMRYRWDLLSAANIIDFVCTLYHYLNDDHIDTVLKKIVPPLRKIETFKCATGAGWGILVDGKVDCDIPYSASEKGAVLFGLAKYGGTVIGTESPLHYSNVEDDRPA